MMMITRQNLCHQQNGRTNTGKTPALLERTFEPRVLRIGPMKLDDHTSDKNKKPRVIRGDDFNSSLSDTDIEQRVRNASTICGSPEEASRLVLETNPSCLIFADAHGIRSHPQTLLSMLPYLEKAGFDTLIWEMWYEENKTPTLFSCILPEAGSVYNALLTKAHELGITIIPGNAARFNALDQNDYGKHVQRRLETDKWVAQKIQKLGIDGHKTIAFFGGAHCWELGIPLYLKSLNVRAVTVNTFSRPLKPQLRIGHYARTSIHYSLFNDWLGSPEGEWVVVRGEASVDLMDYTIIVSFEN